MSDHAINLVSGLPPAPPQELNCDLARPQSREVLLTVAWFAVVFVFYALIWQRAPLMFPDSPTYMSLARDIRQGTLTRLQERTPGYPLFLILNASEAHPTRTLFYSSMLLHFVTVAMLAYLLSLSSVPRWLTVSFLIVSVLPPFIEPAAYVLTETLSQFVLVAAYLSLLLWLVKKGNMFLLVFCAATVLSAFVRPTFQALAPFLALCTLLCFAAHWTTGMSFRRLVTSLGITVTLSLGSLAAYAYVNYYKFGYFGTSTMSAFTISHKTVSFIEELPDQYADVRDILLKYRDRELLKPFSDHAAQMTVWRAIGELRQHYGNDEAKVASRLAEANFYLIKTKPFSYLIECLKSLGTYWMPNELVLSTGTSGGLRILWAGLQLAVVGLFMFQELAVIGLGLMWLSVQAAKPTSALTLSPQWQLLLCAYTIGTGIIAYTAMISCFLGIGSPRFRLPTELLLMVTTVIGYVVWRRLRSAIVSHVQAGARA